VANKKLPNKSNKDTKNEIKNTKLNLKPNTELIENYLMNTKCEKEALPRRQTMNKPIKTCRAYLPPSFSEKCGQAVDPLCQEQCFKHCYNQDYPDNHYLRCKNPKHPPYQESEFLKKFKQSQEQIQQLLWQYPYATEDISHLSKQKLKNAIRKDIIILKEILPLEDCLVPNEDDPEM